MWALAAHHRWQPIDAGSGALAAEATDLGVGPLRPLVMRMLHDEGMEPNATSNRLPGHVEQVKSQPGMAPVPLGLAGRLPRAGGPATWRYLWPERSRFSARLGTAARASPA